MSILSFSDRIVIRKEIAALRFMQPKLNCLEETYLDGMACLSQSQGSCEAGDTSAHNDDFQSHGALGQ